MPLRPLELAEHVLRHVERVVRDQGDRARLGGRRRTSVLDAGRARRGEHQRRRSARRLTRPPPAGSRRTHAVADAGPTRVASANSLLMPERRRRLQSVASASGQRSPRGRDAARRTAEGEQAHELTRPTPSIVALAAHHVDERGADHRVDRDRRPRRRRQQRQVAEQVVEPPAVAAQHHDAGRAVADGAVDREVEVGRVLVAIGAARPRRRSAATALDVVRRSPSRGRRPARRRGSPSRNASATPPSAAITTASSTPVGQRRGARRRRRRSRGLWGSSLPPPALPGSGSVGRRRDVPASQPGCPSSPGPRQSTPTRRDVPTKSPCRRARPPRHRAS